MTEYSWARVLEDMPEYLFNFGEVEPRDGNGIRLRDAETGYEVLFHAVGDEAEIKIPVPADRNVRDRLLAVMRSHRQTSVAIHIDANSSKRVVSELARWNPEPRWVTPAEEAGEGWTAEELARKPDSRARERVARRPETALQWGTYWPDDPADRSRIAAAVVEVLRDGLGATPERLRYSTFDYHGPVAKLYGITSELTSVAPDRPSDRGAPGRCVEWQNFIERFEWVLTTLPWGALLTMSAPGLDRDKCFNQFINDNFAIANESAMWESAGLTREEFHQRMTQLGWKWTPQEASGVEYPGWVGPRVRTWGHMTLGDVAQRTVATFRDVLGVARPDEITFFSWGPDTMTYLDAELGLTRSNP